MRQLETRRERLGTLLAEETFDALHDSSETPQILELARARLAEQGIVTDEAVWEQDRAIFGALDELHLPEDAQCQLWEAVRRALCWGSHQRHAAPEPAHHPAPHLRLH